jgi:prefoldin alpha subunit
MIERQVQQLQQQVQAVDRGIVELSSLSLDLGELSGKKDSEIFAPVGKGIFAKARLLSEDLIVDVGGKKFVSKTIAETQGMISGQIKKLEEVKGELNDNIEAVGSEARKIIDGFQGKEGKNR